MRAASFKHSLLSVDVDVCMWINEAMSASLRLNISEAKKDSGFFPIGSLYKKVPKLSRIWSRYRWRHVIPYIIVMTSTNSSSPSVMTSWKISEIWVWLCFDVYWRRMGIGKSSIHHRKIFSIGPIFMEKLPAAPWPWRNHFHCFGNWAIHILTDLHDAHLGYGVYVLKQTKVLLKEVP